VTIIGGFGLFFEPAGLPRGRLIIVSPSGAEETGGTALGNFGVIRIASMLGLWLLTFSKPWLRSMILSDPREGNVRSAAPAIHKQKEYTGTVLGF
jgi:hypothetical protein